MTEYRSLFGGWDRTAGVRSFQFDTLDWAEGGQWVPSGPYDRLGHPAVDAEALRGRVGAALLLSQLHATLRLESALIAPVCAWLVSGGIDGDRSIVLDAL